MLTDQDKRDLRILMLEERLSEIVIEIHESKKFSSNSALIIRTIILQDVHTKLLDRLYVLKET